MAAPIEWNKVLIEELNGVTYVGIAPYGTKSYNSDNDTAKNIWQIRKIETSNWATEISYPNWDSGNNYAWDDRADLDYK